MRSHTGTVLSNPNCLDLLMFIRDHPGCRKTDLLQNVTRNQSTVVKIRLFIDEGLVDIDIHGRVWLISLTTKGEMVAGLMESMKVIMEPETGGSGAFPDST